MNPPPLTLNPSPLTQHPPPLTLQLQPLTPNPQHPTISPEPSTSNPQPNTLNPSPCILHPTPHTLHPPSTLHPTPYTLHPTPKIPNTKRWADMRSHGVGIPAQHARASSDECFGRVGAVYTVLPWQAVGDYGVSPGATYTRFKTDAFPRIQFCPGRLLVVTPPPGGSIPCILEGILA